MTMQWNELSLTLSQQRPLLEALSDDIRQRILHILATTGSLSVGELALELGLSRPAVSHHLKILTQAGLLSVTRQGTRRYYRPSVANASGAIQEVADAMKVAAETT